MSVTFQVLLSLLVLSSLSVVESASVTVYANSNCTADSLIPFYSHSWPSLGPWSQPLTCVWNVTDVDPSPPTSSSVYYNCGVDGSNGTFAQFQVFNSTTSCSGSFIVTRIGVYASTPGQCAESDLVDYTKTGTGRNPTAWAVIDCSANTTSLPLIPFESSSSGSISASSTPGGNINAGAATSFSNHVLLTVVGFILLAIIAVK